MTKSASMCRVRSFPLRRPSYHILILINLIALIYIGWNFINLAEPTRVIGKTKHLKASHIERYMDSANQAIIDSEPSTSKVPTKIIIITTTSRRHVRMAAMTRLSQTLQHINNIDWVIIEDGNHTVDAVVRLLQRNGIPNIYFYGIVEPGVIEHKWKLRNLGLEYVRYHYKNYDGSAVVYFADDDDLFDVRLFNKYIKNVKTIGVWTVGLSGGDQVEVPMMEDSETKKWFLNSPSNDSFAVDMAGFAINLKLILNTDIIFNENDAVDHKESIFLRQFNITMEPFGYDSNPRKLLVWHLKLCSSGDGGDPYGYFAE